MVIRRIDILVERRGDLFHLERSQEPVIDTVLERVDVNRLAEVGVGVDIILALGRRGETQLHRRSEIFEDAAPIALIIRTAAMALINDDEIEEVGRIVAEIRAGPLACPPKSGAKMS